MKPIGMMLVLLGACGYERLEPWDDGPPEVLQVFVTSEPADDLASGLTLAYGQHFELNGGVAAIGVRATAVPRTGARFRIVVDQLLAGDTIEEYACAGGGFVPLGRKVCADCRDDPSTLDDEAGRCVDLNGDRIPDNGRIVGDVATIRCGSFLYTTLSGDGAYEPWGNQLSSGALGVAGIGPAIVIEPSVTLPADADCTLNVIGRITDKQGEELIWPAAGVRFRTATD